MTKLIPVSIFMAAAFAGSLGAQSRIYNLDVYVTTPSGSSLQGAPYTLHTDLYDMDYAASETKLDASGHSLIRTYAGQHTLRISMEGMKTYTTTFDMDADRRLDIAMQEDIADPYAVSAVLNHDVYSGRNDISMTWNTEEAVFFDDFESYDPFSIDPQPWGGIDIDRLPTAMIDGDYPNRGSMQYITIVNPGAVTPAWDLQYYYTLTPRSGRQYAGFVQPAAGNNNDWFISPLIRVGEDNTLRFYMRVADAGEARLKVGITTAANPTVTDFVTISEGNFLSPGFEEWQEVKIPLTAYAGMDVRIGLNCTSRNGALITMVDDFFVGRINDAAMRSRRVPAYSPGNPAESFIIRMDGAEIGRTENYHFDIADVADGNHTLSVQAVMPSGVSGITETSLRVDSSDYARADMNVTTNNTLSPDGFTVTVCGEHGTWPAVVSQGKASIASLPKGTYSLAIEAEGYEALEQILELNADKSVTLPLIEKIVAPFNITADVTATGDNSANVVLNWNRDLGFCDSFEDYANFATGSFGGWTTLNFNGEHQTSYPISLGGYEITFPGCSTSQAPASVPPLVFNPLATRPSLSSDDAFRAPYGDKYLAFMGPQQMAADKWAISPQVKIYDNYQFSMVAKAYPIYPETVELLINTTDREPENFELLDRVTLSYNNWMKYVVDLSTYVGKSACIAIRCVTHDGFVAQVDDVRIEPASESVASSIGFVQSYDVSVDGTHKANVEQPLCMLQNLTMNDHTIGVKANYRTGTSPETTYLLSMSGVDETPAVSGTVRGVHGAISIQCAAGTECRIMTLDGRCAAQFVASDHEARINLPAGIYLARIGTHTVKVMVK